MVGVIDWCEGSRIGVDSFALTRFVIEPSLTFSKILQLKD
jgi:hypothetical protein